MTRPIFVFAMTGVLLLRYYGFAEAPLLPETQLVELDTEPHPDPLAFLNSRPYKELVVEAAVRYQLHPQLIGFECFSAIEYECHGLADTVQALHASRLHALLRCFRIALDVPVRTAQLGALCEP